MGEYADDAANEAIDDVFGDSWYITGGERRELIEDNFDCDVWTTKSLKGIPLHKMVDEHIEGAITHIKKFGPKSCFGYGSMWLVKLEAEQRRRKDNGES